MVDCVVSDDVHVCICVCGELCEVVQHVVLTLAGRELMASTYRCCR